MKAFIRRILRVYLRPFSSMKVLAAEGKLGESLLILFLMLALDCWLTVVLDGDIAAVFQVTVAAVVVLVQLAALLGFSLAAYLLACMFFGGHGRYQDVVKLFSYLSLWQVLPLIFLAVTKGQSSLESYVLLGYHAWLLLLSLFALKAALKFSFLRAVLSLGIPLAAAAVILLAGGIFFVQVLYGIQ